MMRGGSTNGEAAQGSGGAIFGRSLPRRERLVSRASTGARGARRRRGVTPCSEPSRRYGPEMPWPTPGNGSQLRTARHIGKVGRNTDGGHIEKVTTRDSALPPP